MSDDDGVGLWCERWSSTYPDPNPHGFVVKHGLGLDHNEVTVNVGDDQGHPIEAEVAHLDANHLAIRVGYYVGGLGEAQWHPTHPSAVVVSIIRSA
jgi:hypothetical protein